MGSAHGLVLDLGLLNVALRLDEAELDVPNLGGAVCRAQRPGDDGLQRRHNLLDCLCRERAESVQRVSARTWQPVSTPDSGPDRRTE